MPPGRPSKSTRTASATAARRMLSKPEELKPEELIVLPRSSRPSVSPSASPPLRRLCTAPFEPSPPARPSPSQSARKSVCAREDGCRRTKGGGVSWWAATEVCVCSPTDTATVRSPTSVRVPWQSRVYRRLPPTTVRPPTCSVLANRRCYFPTIPTHSS